MIERQYSDEPCMFCGSNEFRGANRIVWSDDFGYHHYDCYPCGLCGLTESQHGDGDIGFCRISNEDIRLGHPTCIYQATGRYLDPSTCPPYYCL